MTKQKNHGEGDRESAAAYNERARSHVAETDVKKKADEAAKAMEDPTQRADLESARKKAAAKKDNVGTAS